MKQTPVDQVRLEVSRMSGIGEQGKSLALLGRSGSLGSQQGVGLDPIAKA